MLHLFYGDDGFSRQEALVALKEGLGDRENLATNTSVFDGQQLSLNALKAACETMPFLAPKRLVIIEGLLGRYEPSGRDARRPRGRRQAGENGYKEMAAYLGQLPEFTELVLLDGKLTQGRNPLFREVSSFAQVRTFAPLRDNELRPWIEGRVTGGGGAISQKAIAVLVRYVGANLRVMASEIVKLLLYTGGRQIEVGDVRALVSYVREANIFAMVDAVLAGRQAPAQQIMQQLLRQGEAPGRLMAMIIRQVRILLRTRALKNRGQTQKAIGEKLGLSGFPLQRALEEVERHPLPELKMIHRRLLEADVAVKTGKSDEETALHILIVELCQGLSSGAAK